jgi:hypothetical protein
MRSSEGRVRVPPTLLFLRPSGLPTSFLDQRLDGLEYKVGLLQCFLSPLCIVQRLGWCAIRSTVEGRDAVFGELLAAPE